MKKDTLWKEICEALDEYRISKAEHLINTYESLYGNTPGGERSVRLIRITLGCRKEEASAMVARGGD